LGNPLVVCLPFSLLFLLSFRPLLSPTSALFTNIFLVQFFSLKSASSSLTALHKGIMKRDEILAAAAVESLISDGHVIVIFEDYVLKLDSWLEKHPGGRLAILHMVGKDATDEIKA